MVVGAFPIAKLSVLLIKQISKPIANACKERAKNSPFFRTYVCMPPAQFYNWCEVKAKMWILNLGKPVNIPVLSQEMAIELGANLLGETVIFVIGAGLLIVEYNRQSKKEASKEKKRQDEMNHFTNTITDLYFTVQRQQTQLKEMERIVLSLGGPQPSITPQTPPTQPSTTGPSPPAGGAGSIHQINYTQHNSSHVSTPYPNEGVILKSLNYIQMDVLNTLFSESDKVEKHETIVQTSSKREPAVVSRVLHNIENDFRSLF